MLMKNQFKIIHLRNKCIGCNACVESAPYRWRISKKDGKSVLIGGKEKKGIFIATVNNDEYNENLEASNNCPVNIIRLDKS